MPLNISLLNIKGIEVKNLHGINPMKVFARFCEKNRCPFCKGVDLRKKTRFERKVRHESIGNRTCILVLEGHKFLCKTCGKYFNQRFPGLLKWKRSTEAFRREIFEKHKAGISQVDLSKMARIGSATIERWYHDFLKRKAAEVRYEECPKYLGIDEHFFSKKHGFVTTLCALDRHRVFDLIPGKSARRIEGPLSKLKGREKVEMVCMDLCDHYRTQVKRFFPNAKIVADRFHVVRLINQSFLKTWHNLDPKAKHSRGLLSLMRRHRWHLNKDQLSNLYRYFQTVPGLEQIYLFKQSLVQMVLHRHRTQKQAQQLIPKFLSIIARLQNSHFEPLVTLGNTLKSWKEEIACMWRFTKSNSITEGFHRKMKLIQRRAYGFRNFQNYRLRVLALCS